MRSAKDFFQPMAIGAPTPPREIPFTPSRMIHFFDPSNAKMATKVPDMAKKCDVLLGNPGVLTGSGGLSFQHTYIDDTQMEVILRAVEKSERIQQITAPRITVYNTQRANVQLLSQVPYVADYEVEIAQLSNIANPVIQYILDGVVLDVQPVVSADRRFVSLTLRPTVAVLTRPIATFSTSLASGPIASAPVVIQIPELRVSRVRTTVNMPDKGTLLLGGLPRLVGQALRPPAGLSSSRYVDVRSDLDQAKLLANRPVPVQVDGDFIGTSTEVLFEHRPDALVLARTDLLED